MDDLTKCPTCKEDLTQLLVNLGRASAKRRHVTGATCPNGHDWTLAEDGTRWIEGWPEGVPHP